MISGFNIGKEVSLDLVHPTIGIIPLGLVTSFESRPLKSRLNSIPITNGGKAIYRNIYTGWEGTFDIDRSNGIVDALIQLLEDGYYGGQPETYFLLTETIRNPDTSVDEFRYKNVVLEPESHGTWKTEEKVTQKLAWVATLRERV
jgi:hypothetical protein